MNLIRYCPWFAMFGGLMTPGILDADDPFPGLSSPRGWDERKGYGLSGATLVFKGRKLAEFSIKGHLFEDSHFDDYDAFWPTIIAMPNTANPKAFDLVHPLVQDVEVYSVNVVDALGKKQTDDGRWTWEIKVKEYRQPLPQLANPKSSQSSKGGAKPEDPKDAELRQLTSQLNDQGNALDNNLRRIGV